MMWYLCVIPWLLGMMTLTVAHEWYPPECCAEKDCRPVPCEEVRPARSGIIDGWKYQDHFFKTATPSPDEQCHACFVDSPKADGLCLFMPQSNV